ncbi:TonB-dependent receptor [Sediminibacterium ginsengisoli]|uniref:Outer membrane receptor proteins, mostly Fe transport n=1 Tax=Sediminibacterium ginsengisoli TaxID=413434 RepID=A0A1T4LCC9_9BACT|nr:TonB-dependent receptor [Sediminibacterium ginsengisoli]SJZ52350.1 Outer membrane receptor proteins, mostly Fe transport [Sediminibacterium ginsengisoli]
MKNALTCLLCLLAAVTNAQTFQGTVYTNEGKPLEEATVLNLRNGIHTHTNELGVFRLKDVNTGDSLRITHISYSPYTIAIAGKNDIEIRLHPAEFKLDEVAIRSSLRHLNIIADIDLVTNPVNTSQELLRKVPGLFIGQHAGGGKAEQIFLRGFDVDHGTDVNISVDGMPVNMVSHAHGQGYADLHFLIPETIEKIDFDKGPYHASRGDFATAGYVAFRTAEDIDKSSVSLGIGKFNTLRTLGMFRLAGDEKEAAWLATEYMSTNGYFESPQHFNRLNLMGKYTAFLPRKNKLSLSFSHLDSRWDASGQIPQRAVDNGSITRFGAIDNTEGGNTRRTNLNLQFFRYIDAGTFVKNTAYFTRYDFELYSNFTFFLNDPVNGDQIRQKEKRTLAGFESEFNKNLMAGNIPVALQVAAGLRNDAVRDLELSHTLNRKTTLQEIQLGDADQVNLYGYVNTDWRLGKWLINPAIRIDHFRFGYTDKLAAAYQSQQQEKTTISPKLNFIYTPNRNLQYFLKLGKGFHSNDTRVVVAQSGKEILPAAYGADLGVVWKPWPKLVMNAALWYLHLQQEFVYVGDEGVVEPGGKTRRMGVDLGLRYQVGSNLFFDGDLTYTHARATDEPKGSDHIPLAPVVTVTGGISYRHHSGFNGSVRTRYLGHRPANEDNTIVAKGYHVTDLSLAYQWNNWTIGVITENIFNTAWNETQFATETRLSTEPAPVTEIHFTPGTPFNIRGVLTYRF